MKESPPPSVRVSPTPRTLLRLASCVFCLLLCGDAVTARQSGYFEIVSRHTGKCLDVAGVSSSNGAATHQWDCVGGTNQQWQLISNGDGYYRIIARHSGKALEVAGGSLSNGAAVQQWDYVGATNQQWQRVDLGNGYFRLTARHSGKALDISGASYLNGAIAHQWDYVGATNQQWQLRTVTEGADPRSRTGAWSALINNLPFIPVHAHMLPNRKVLAWAGENVDAPQHRTDVWVWDAATGMFNDQTAFRADNNLLDIFCSGHSFLPDGRLLVAGGHHHYDAGNPAGEPHTSVFDYRNNTWTRGPDMSSGRWYPTNTTLNNGEVLVVAGAVADGAQNDLPEIWQVSQTLRTLGDARRGQPTYPWMHVGPGGKVFNSGPNQNTDYLNPSVGGAWLAARADNIPINNNYGYRGEGTSVMYQPGKVLILAGGDPPTNSAEVLDLNLANPVWRTLARAMARARRHVNGTVLPDGTVLVTGGTSYGGFNDPNPVGAVYAPEIWNPAGEQWSGPLASMQIPRLYHSVALLLPDGRVLSAGGGNGGGGVDYPNAEIYSPPYLFKGAQPQLTNAPDSIGYGQTFFVSTPNTDIARATLVRLSSVTHSYNQNQRFNELTVVSRVAGGLNLRAPADGDACPPGHYMLFLLNNQGVPSVARVVQVVKSSVVSVANGADNLSRVVWQLPNGGAQVWTVSANGGTRLNSVTHVPQEQGWSPRQIAVGADNVPYLLWSHIDGRIWLWRLNQDNSQHSSRMYGPFAGWKVVGLAGGTDGRPRVLWERISDGRTDLWRVNPDFSYTYVVHGPFAGWRPVSIAVGYDNRPRIVWRYDNGPTDPATGKVSVWNCNPDGTRADYREHGPFAGWRPRAVAVGRDNQAHLLWSHYDGRIGVWTVDAAGNRITNADYGPHSGWTALALGNGGDSQSRLTWQHSNGRLSLWTLDANNVQLSYTEYASP
ncbi:MAG TPA: RICIN domain-containing protein [Pyrinomonadaceae bacterium]